MVVLVLLMMREMFVVLVCEKRKPGEEVLDGDNDDED